MEKSLFLARRRPLFLRFSMKGKIEMTYKKSVVASRRAVTPCTEPRVVHVGQDPVQVESDLGEVAVVPGPAGWPGLLSITFI